jgi:hypothetical protein
MDKAARTAQLARCIAHTGDEWSAGGAVFFANASELRPDDPRLEGGLDTFVELTAATADLPSPPLRQGSEIVREGRAHRIVRIDTGLHGLTRLLVTR